MKQINEKLTLTYTHTKLRLTSVKSDVKEERGKLWLVVSRQEFSAVGALVEQLSLLVDKVCTNEDVEFFGHAKVACAFPWPVWPGSINNIPRELVVGSFVG